VNIDSPRMCYNTTPWPTWNGSLAPDITIFMPVHERSVGLYQIPVAAVNEHNNNNANNANANNANNNNAANAAAVNVDNTVPNSQANNADGIAGQGSNGSSVNSNGSNFGGADIRGYQSFNNTNPPPGTAYNAASIELSRLDGGSSGSSSGSSGSSSPSTVSITNNGSVISNRGGVLNSVSSMLRSTSRGPPSSSSASTLTTYSRLHRHDIDANEGKDTRLDDSV
jgi:hypothetical protein